MTIQFLVVIWWILIPTEASDRFYNKISFQSSPGHSLSLPIANDFQNIPVTN